MTLEPPCIIARMRKHSRQSIILNLVLEIPSHYFLEINIIDLQVWANR
ncbi:hypothetical protein [Helicobacter sp. MIT 05-5294]|nr:hypothetical protein [Helicobacter sp. MIT 05-5294]